MALPIRSCFFRPTAAAMALVLSLPPAFAAGTETAQAGANPAVSNAPLQVVPGKSAQTGHGPESVADLAAGLLDAVVNILSLIHI